MIGLLVVSQGIYQLRSYNLLGIHRQQVFSNLGITTQTPLWYPADGPRQACSRYAECYLAPGAAVSTTTDLSGTFLRSRDEPIFQSGLAPAVVAALSRIDRMPAWASRTAMPISDRGKLTATLNGEAGRIDAYLSDVVHVAPADLPALSAADGSALVVELIEQRFTRNRLTVDYWADAPFILNAAISYDPRWSASVNGEPARVVRANYGGLAILAPKGAGQVEFYYRDVAGRWLLVSRILLNLAAIATVVLLGASLLGGARLRPFLGSLPSAVVAAAAVLRAKVAAARAPPAAPGSEPRGGAP